MAPSGQTYVVIDLEYMSCYGFMLKFRPSLTQLVAEGEAGYRACR